jgi:hypothetical protein
MINTKDAVQLKRLAQRTAAFLQSASALLIATIGLLKLAWMNFEGLPTLAASVFGVFVATTSLLYNRARAYPTGRVQRRTLFAAEHALRATLLLVVGVTITAVLFWFIPESYRTDPMAQNPNHVLPAMAAFPGVLMFASSSYAYVGALAAMLPPMITPLRRKQRFRRDFPR